MGKYSFYFFFFKWNELSYKGKISLCINFFFDYLFFAQWFLFDFRFLIFDFIFVIVGIFNVSQLLFHYFCYKNKVWYYKKSCKDQKKFFKKTSWMFFSVFFFQKKKRKECYCFLIFSSGYMDLCFAICKSTFVLLFVTFNCYYFLFFRRLALRLRLALRTKDFKDWRRITK